MRNDELEARISDLAQQVATEFTDLGDDLRWAIARALIHRGIHFAAEHPGVEYCTVATYLGDMVGHAHKLMHGENPKAHREYTH